MPALLQPLTNPTALSPYLKDLEAAHDALAASFYVAAQAVTQPTAGKAFWAVTLKRTPVALSGIHPMVTVAHQPLGELLNQLATVERLLDALRWAQTNGMTCVLECHPTTSRGPKGRCSHDLVVADTTGVVVKMVFEVSDVAGTGNANYKMTNDLDILLGAPTGRKTSRSACTCVDAAGHPARKLLAVSPSSGKWLKTSRPTATVHNQGNGATT